MSKRTIFFFPSNTIVWTSLIAQLVKNPPAMQETLVRFLGWGIHWRRDKLPTPVFLGFPTGSAGKKSSANMGDLGSIPGLGWSPGERKGYPLQYSGLENSMDCISMGSPRVGHDWVTFTFTFQQRNGIIKVPFCLLYINMKQKFEKAKREKDGETCQKLPSIIQVNILAMN